MIQVWRLDREGNHEMLLSVTSAKLDSRVMHLSFFGDCLLAITMQGSATAWDFDTGSVIGSIKLVRSFIDGLLDRARPCPERGSIILKSQQSSFHEWVVGSRFLADEWRK
jgi:hypothetical protein